MQKLLDPSVFIGVLIPQTAGTTVRFLFRALTMVFVLTLIPPNAGVSGPNSPPIPDIGPHLTMASNTTHLVSHPELRHDDDTLAALTIYFEAQGESFAGKLAVAAVIRNRMLHRFHSDGTVRGTVLRPKQFQPWMTRNPDRIPFQAGNSKMQESLLAWKMVQDGRRVVDGAVLFYNPQIVKAPRWARVHRKVARIGGHDFFHPERI
jgi:spore germination cell wall hydrolase CwlJ-like protein